MTERTTSMSRARLYAAFEAFEGDIRRVLQRYVLDEIGVVDGLSHSYEQAFQRAEQEDDDDEENLIHYLDLRPGYDLLNRHRQRLPMELANETRELTDNLNTLVPIRNRVMHFRPLRPGDGDSALALLSQYRSTYWRETQKTLSRLRLEPHWEPSLPKPTEAGSVIHNLPLADYDETGLIGRQTEIEDIAVLVKRKREPVITITGEGGIGKTALALEVAYRLVDDPEEPFDIVLWTSLKHEKLTAYGVRDIVGATRDIVGAVESLSQPLGMDYSSSVDDLADLLTGFSTLFVVDNLETISGDEFKILYDKLPQETIFLLTSRIGLGELERRYPLKPLSDKDSLHLFNVFAKSRGVSALRSLSNETRIKAVERLRYSPLAIKWFILAVEAGSDALMLIRRQDELLEFCVRSVYDELSGAARDILETLLILQRPLTSDELVILLEESIDQIQVGIQELVRGSLVRQESSPDGVELSFRIVLTDTASHFLDRRIEPNEGLRNRLQRTENEYREDQERRASDARERQLAPHVVSIRTENDNPAAAILRRALRIAKSTGHFDEPLAQVDIAQRMNPEFWEVFRVRGFLLNHAKDISGSTTNYERAYALASGKDRAVVSYFYAGHLARTVRDVGRAVNYAREAHDSLNHVETATALATYLTWVNEFEEAISLLRSVVPTAKGVPRLIAINALAQAWKRYAEYASNTDRNFLKQCQYGFKAYNIAITAIEQGLVDRRLRDVACESATTALRGAIQCMNSNIRVPALADYLTILTDGIPVMEHATGWNYLLNAINSLREVHKDSARARTLWEVAQVVQRADDSIEEDAGGRLIGTIHSVLDSYGFISHPRYARNVFFHQSVLEGLASLEDLSPGQRVGFAAEDTPKGVRASYVVLHKGAD